MTIAEVEDYKDSYYNRFFENIDDMCALMPQYEAKADAVINRAFLLVENYIVSKNPYYDYEDITTTQGEKLKEAVLEELYYIVHGLDFSVLTGFNRTTGVLMPKEEIAGRVIGEQTKMILKRAGLLYFIKGIPEVEV